MFRNAAPMQFGGSVGMPKGIAGYEHGGGPDIADGYPNEAARARGMERDATQTAYEETIQRLAKTFAKGGKDSLNRWENKELDTLAMNISYGHNRDKQEVIQDLEAAIYQLSGNMEPEQGIMDMIREKMGGSTEQAMPPTGMMHGGIARLQDGGAELFNPAEFMGQALNEMAPSGTGSPETASPGFFPEGNFGVPSGGEETGILSGLGEAPEEIGSPVETDEELGLAKQQAMSIFDTMFEETMSVLQAEMSSGTMPSQNIDMVLRDEIEVIEGQAEAQVKEAMSLPEEVDLIPAEVSQSYLEKARMIVGAPQGSMDMGQPDMSEEDMAVERMFGGGATPGINTSTAVAEEDPLSIIEQARIDSSERMDKRRKEEMISATGRETDLSAKVKAGDFQPLKTDFSELENLVYMTGKVAQEAAENESYISGAAAGMGGSWLEALTIKPKRGRQARDKAVLEAKKEIATLKVAEDKAIKAGDAEAMKSIFLQGQKIKDQLSNTLLNAQADIEGRALSETGDIITKQIGDENMTDTWRTDQYWLDVLEDPNSSDLQKRVAQQALGIGSGKGDVNSRTAEFVKLANAAWKDYKSRSGGSMDYVNKVKRFEEEFAPLIKFNASTILPTDPNFSTVVRDYMMSQDSGAQAASSAPIDVGYLTPDQLKQALEGGFYPSGTVLKTADGQITVP
jgi:hypothetical protein